MSLGLMVSSKFSVYSVLFDGVNLQRRLEDRNARPEVLQDAFSRPESFGRIPRDMPLATGNALSSFACFLGQI
jgi:hypothetical protein